MDIVHFQNNNSEERPRILVCGATGWQGGAIIKWLSGAGGRMVAALNRDIGSPNAIWLKGHGIMRWQADEVTYI